MCGKGKNLCKRSLFFGLNCRSRSNVSVKPLRNHRYPPKQKWLRVLFGAGEFMKGLTMFLPPIVAMGMASTASARDYSDLAGEGSRCESRGVVRSSKSGRAERNVPMCWRVKKGLERYGKRILGSFRPRIRMSEIDYNAWTYSLRAACAACLALYISFSLNLDGSHRAFNIALSSIMDSLKTAAMV